MWSRGTASIVKIDTIVDLLRVLHEKMPTGGQILTDGIVDRFHTARSLRLTFGLHHIYRTGQQVQRMLESVGFHMDRKYEEPFGIYPILIATR